jgi:hypothetical protein
MDLLEHLAHYGTSFEQLVAKSQQQLSLAEGDILCACGSLVDGLGNEDSDVDLLWVTSRAENRAEATFAIGKCTCDATVITPEDLERLLGAAARWPSEPDDVRAIAGDYRQRRLLHRLRQGIPLHGARQLTALQARIEPLTLQRQNLACARYHVSTLQIDLAGLRKASDWVTMRFVALELLNHTVDALLAVHGFTNPTPKWRTRLLERLPRSWALALPGRPRAASALDTYLSFYEQPEQMSPSDSYQLALKVVGFSRAVLAWAEHRLAMPDVALPEGRVSGSGGFPGVPLMPQLDLDVAIKLRHGRFELTRLRSREQSYALSARAFWLLCQFDGETSLASLRQLAATIPPASGPETVDDLIALVRHARLEAPPVIDEGRIQDVLRAVR